MEGCRLKRVVLLGDVHQLPPIVQSATLAHACGLDQSLFARLIRLRVPTVQLDAQGRCRPALARLFAWRYENLHNLPAALPATATRANACLRYVCQAVDVEDYANQGEVTTADHSVNNEGEAEYVVAFFEYLRLCGYPAEIITILSAYKSQRECIQAKLKERCKKNPLFGMPRKVTTIDKYQGQQNEIVLLSLVRTRSVGYLRDVRRLLVGVSRAKLGLYVFCRASLFRECAELKPIMDVLLEKPVKLALVENEYYPCERKEEEEVKSFEVGEEREGEA